MDVIIQQLKDFCDCLPEMEDSFFERNVTELINLISNLTCWTQQPCETFLNSERSETIDLKEFNKCACNGGIVEFEPYYRPFQPDTFKVYLVEQDGIKENATEIDPSDYFYGAAFGVLRIDVSDCIDGWGCCCPKKYKLVIVYDAGYEQIPDCLLQLFCDLLHVVYDKNNCDCSVCQACSSTTDGEIVPEYSEGDEVSPKLSIYLNRLIESGYKKELGLISLCNPTKGKVWGVVV